MSTDYFANHARARRFPWSLYHAPIEKDLVAFLRRVVRDDPNARVLVVGCGLLHELEDVPSGVELVVADIDPRAIDAVLARRDPRIRRGIVVTGSAAGELGEGYAAVYAKEVVEHVIDSERWLESLRSALRPGGRLWLSTPNYGEPWLALLESTVLEWVARRDGFSRRHLHPSRFSRRRLARALQRSGFSEVHVRPVATRLALVAHARKPA